MVKEHKGEVLPMMLQIGHRIDGGPANLGASEPPGSQRHLPDGRVDHEGRAHGAQRAGDRPAAHALRTVRTLVLQNKSNFCYSHSALLGLLWTRLSGQPDDDTVRCWGPALLSLLALAAKASEACSSVGVLRTRAGEAPQSQHDVGEYLQFLEPLLTARVSGTWESRVSMQGQSPLCIDQGSTWPLAPASAA